MMNFDRVLYPYLLLTMASQEDERLELAIAITKAITNEEFSSIKTFIEKFYKRSLSDKNKINQIRLTRFNALLYKVHYEFNILKSEDLKVVFKTIFCFLLKISSFLKEKSTYSSYEERLRLISATYHWVAQLLVSAANSSRGTESAIQLMDWIVKDIKLKVMKFQEFQTMLEASPYFSKIHLNQEEEAMGNDVKSKKIIVQEQEPQTAIIKRCNLKKLFFGLIYHSMNFSKVFEYFLLMGKKEMLQNFSKFDFLYQLFIKQIPEQRKITTSYKIFLKEVLDKGQLSYGNSLIIKQEIAKRKQLISKMKKAQSKEGTEMPVEGSEQEEPKTKDINNMNQSVEYMIEEFVSSKKPTFAQLHQILKLKHCITKSVWNYLQDPMPLTNSKVIVISLMIAQSKKSLATDLLKFYQTIQKPKDQQKVAMLHILHLALQQSPVECELFTNILQNVKQNQLNEVCKYDFLPLQTVQRPKSITKQQKTQLQELINIKAQPNQHIFKIKIDLNSMIGESTPFLNAMQKINLVTSRSIQQMIQSLSTEKSQQINEVVLLRINNLMKQRYIQDVPDKALEWFVKSFNTYNSRFVKQCKQYFSSINKSQYFNLAIIMKMHNLCRQKPEDMLIISEIPNFFNQDLFLKLQDEQYSGYLIQTQNINTLEGQCHRTWSHLVEVVRFLSLIDQKNHSKKQVKKILDKFKYPSIYILQSIHYALKNNITDKDLIAKMIKLLETDYDTLEQLEKRTVDSDLDYYPFQNFFDYMLSLAYEQSVIFINNLLKSSKFIKEQKPQKKKKGQNLKKNSKTNVPDLNKVIRSLISCLPILLNQPNRLKDINIITQIIEKLIQNINPEEEKQLISCVIGWISQFQTLSFSNFNQFLNKLRGLKDFWTKTHDFLKGNISKKQIESQFTYFSILLRQSKQYKQREESQKLQKEILTILQLVYTLQPINYQKGIRNIDQQKIHAIFDVDRRKNVEANYFFCEDCDKNVCEGCYNFLHRNHDVNFVTRDKGSCAHQLVDKKRQLPNISQVNNSSINNPNNVSNPNNLRRPDKFITKYINSQDIEQIIRLDSGNELHFQKVAMMQRMMLEKRRDKDRFIERALERGIDINIPAILNDPSTRFQIGYNPSSMPISNPFQQPASQPAPAANPVLAIDCNEKQSSQNNFQIKSESQQSIIEINNKQNIYIQKTVFQSEPKYNEDHSQNLIKMDTLLKQLINTIPQTKIVGVDDADDGLLHILQKYNFDTNPIITTELVQEKYMMTKLSISKLGGTRYDIIDTDERADRKLKMYTNGKILICSNQKYIVVTCGCSLTFLQQYGLRKSFKKREKAKRYNDADNQESSRLARKIDVPFQILDIAFSNCTPNHMCALGANQLNIINTSTASNRDFKRTVFKFVGESDIAIKFKWLPMSSYKLIVQFGTELKLFEFQEQQLVSNSPKLTFIKRLAIDKEVEDFSVRLNTTSRIYTCFFLTIDGSIHSEKFNARGQLSEESKLVLPEHKDQLNCMMISLRSDFGFLSFKDGSNFIAKVKDSAVCSVSNLKFSRILNPNSDSHALFDKFGSNMVQVKQIFISKEIVVLGCVLRKQISGQTSGNFAIVQMYGQNNVNIIMMNDGFKTQTFEVLNYEDESNKQKFMIVGIQNDGYLWVKAYQVRKLNNKQITVENISDDKIEFYNKAILPLLKSQFGEDRLVQFKEHMKLQNQQLNITPDIKEVQIISKSLSFITGISFRVEALGKMKFKIFQSVYEFNVKKQRQLQIPLTLRQSLLTFINKRLVIQVTYHKQINLQMEVYGWTYERASPIKQIYKQLVQSWYFNNNFAPKDVSHYFNNPSRFDFFNINPSEMSNLIKDNNLDAIQANFIIKLQFLTQAIENDYSCINTKTLEQFIQKFKKYMWVNRTCLATSIQRAYKKVFSVYKKVASLEGKSIVYGDAYDYHTFMDTLTVQNCYKQFLLNPCYSSFDQVVQTLIKMRNKRICNLFLMFALFPTIIWRLANYYTMELERVTIQFNKKKVGDRLVSMIILVCEYFEYLKNKKKEGEVDTFRLLQMLLVGISRNKDLFKQLIVRSFQYLQTVPLRRQVGLSYGCKLFELAEESSVIEMEEEAPSREIYSDVMEEQKQFQEDDGEMMRIDEDYEDIVEHTERTSSIQIFQTQIQKDLKIGQSIKKLIQNRGVVQLNFTYYDIIYHLITGLFEYGILKPQTNNFYIGLFFNLMNLLNVRIFKYESKYNMIESWLNLLNKQLNKKESSALFLVLSHFTKPDYDKIRNISSQQTPKIKDLVVDYYTKKPEQLPFKYLFDVRIFSGVQRTIKLKQALTSNEVVCDSIIYQLKYLGNLYMCLLASGMEMKKLDPKIKQFIIKIFVKKKLRVYKNILILEGWLQDLDQMKYQVAFQDIAYGDTQKGIKRMIDTMTQKPQTLVEFLKDNADKFQTLESLLEKDISSQQKSEVIQIIDKYYSSI